MCHRFDECGVYYYSDIVENECASYIGIIVVKPKTANHDIQIVNNIAEAGTKEKTRNILQIKIYLFLIDIKPIEAGDRVWWRWNPNLKVSISFLEANLLYDKKVEPVDCKKTGN